MKKTLEITDEDRAEIGKLIAKGQSGGKLDCDNGKHITWSIELMAWEDN
jgi:hypothetical protein